MRSCGHLLDLARGLAVEEHLPVDVELVVLQVDALLRRRLLDVSHELPQLLPALPRLLGEVLGHGDDGLPQTLGGLEHIVLIFEVFKCHFETFDNLQQTFTFQTLIEISTTILFYAIDID